LGGEAENATISGVGSELIIQESCVHGHIAC
jgi:hypothetical protein